MNALFFDGLWQGAIVVALAIVVTKYFARESAVTRYAVWMLSLVALVAIPVVTAFVPIHLPALEHSVASGAPGKIRLTLVAVDSVAAGSRMSIWVLALWACGAAAMLLRLAVSAARIEAIRRNAAPAIFECSAVLASDDIAAPIAAGVFSPVIIVPRVLLERLDRDDLRRIIAHERAHIERNDIAATYAQRLIEALLFFNPWVFAIGRSLVNEREAVCDDLAVAATGESHDYAACLVSLAATIAGRRDPLVSPGVFGSRRALVGRIERLVTEGKKRTISLNYATIAATVALLIVATVIVAPFAPAIASSSAPGESPLVVARSCAVANRDASITHAAPPEFPPGAHPKRPALVQLTISSAGIVTNAVLKQSSGDWRADMATVQATTHSIYLPAIKNCRAIQGSYLFRAEFAP